MLSCLAMATMIGLFAVMITTYWGFTLVVGSDMFANAVVKAVTLLEYCLFRIERATFDFVCSC